MIVENGEWIMQGISWDDPACVHSADVLLEIVEQYGFLPLFSNEVEGFSVEEMTAPVHWWSGNEEIDPWEWRNVLAKTGKVAYGKFFNKKAGFVSKKWFPYFANYRREGYDFDARYEDGKAQYRESLIMKLFLPTEVELSETKPRSIGKYVANPELFSFELKQLAGFGKGGEKNFEGVAAKLQMDSYLVVKEFKQKVNKKGEPYGWSNAIYTLPEYIWGYDYVTGKYKESPEDSYKKIVKQIRKYFPADEKLIGKVI